MCQASFCFTPPENTKKLSVICASLTVLFILVTLSINQELIENRSFIQIVEETNLTLSEEVKTKPWRNLKILCFVITHPRNLGKCLIFIFIFGNNFQKILANIAMFYIEYVQKMYIEGL